MLLAFSWVFASTVKASLIENPLAIDVGVTDGSYAVKVNGETWFRNGGLRLFANGEWHGPQPTRPGPRCG